MIGVEGKCRPLFGRIFGKEGTVRSLYTRSEIRKDLSQFGMRPSFFFTVFRIKGMKIEQYQAFKEFLAQIHRTITSTQEIDFAITLRIPAAKALRRVNFNRVVSNEAAMNSVYENCVFKTAAADINIEKLPRIYNLFFPLNVPQEN